jgi:hypothetical protein
MVRRDRGGNGDTGKANPVQVTVARRRRRQKRDAGTAGEGAILAMIFAVCPNPLKSCFWQQPTSFHTASRSMTR